VAGDLDKLAVLSPMLKLTGPLLSLVFFIFAYWLLRIQYSQSKAQKRIEYLRNNILAKLRLKPTSYAFNGSSA